MRKSRYTIVVEGEGGEHLLYNAATGAFAVVGSRAFAAFEAVCKGEAVDADAIAPLAGAGFLTELSLEEELAAEQALFEAERDDFSRLTLSLAPTYACNCRCPYCYEQDKDTAASMMGADVVEAAMGLVAHRYAAHPFDRLSVQWYGGDPSLALDVVEGASNQLLAWCDERGVVYDALMLSNCACIDDAAAALLARCRVSSVLVTIDGPRDIHNVRRPTVEGDDAFAHVMGAIDALQAHGVRVDAMINLDKVTMPLYPALRDDLAARGVALSMAKLNDYAHTFGQGRFAPPDFQLFTHDGFHEAQRTQFLSEPHRAEEFRALLAPSARFCEGQRCNYFVIDYRGDVYRCDGWMGDRSCAIGSLVEGASDARANADALADAPITFDPFADEMCRDCEILPLCWGNCSWERERCGWPCHPLKADGALADYLRAWRRASGVPAPDEDRVVFIAPPAV